MYFGNCGVKQAGYDYDDKAFEIVFNRIYAIFGSAAPYTLYEDAKPFLRWLRSQGILVGVVSNASYRYRDVILPLLGLNQVGFYHPFCFNLTETISIHVISFFVGEEHCHAHISICSVDGAKLVLLTCNVCPTCLFPLRKDYLPG